MTLDTKLTLSKEAESSVTYRVEQTKIQGTIEGLAALRQSILKLLSVQKYEHAIYDFTYGIDLESLIGKDRAYVEVEAKRRIKEALLSDERIRSVGNFQYTYNEDCMYIQCDVTSIYGDILVGTEVMV